MQFAILIQFFLNDLTSQAPYIKAVYFKQCPGAKYVPYGVDCMGTGKWDNPRCDASGDQSISR